MEGGDISNEQSARLVIVFENLLGTLPNAAAVTRTKRLVSRGRWTEAVESFALNEALAARIWDVVWRLKYSVDVVTWISPEFRDALEARIDREDLPVGHVLHDKPTTLARKLPYMPYVAAIYDPDPQHRFLFGSKTRILSPAHPDLIGAF